MEENKNNWGWNAADLIAPISPIKVNPEKRFERSDSYQDAKRIVGPRKINHTKIEPLSNKL